MLATAAILGRLVRDHYRTSSWTSATRIRHIQNAILCLMFNVFLVNIDALRSQRCLCFFNLCHQFFMCLWNIVETVHVVAEFEEEIGAEGYEYPEWKLL